MTTKSAVLLAVTWIVLGLVLALALPDLELLIFRGRPLGVVLTVVGIVELVDAARKPADGR